MSTVMYFISSEYGEGNAAGNSMSSACQSHMTYPGDQQYLWDGRSNLPRNAVRAAELEWVDGDKVFYTQNGYWKTEVLGEMSERSEAWVELVLSRLRETNQFPGKVVRFFKWVDSRLVNPEGRPRFAPVFRVSSWEPPASETLEYPLSLDSKRNCIGVLMGGSSDEEVAEIMVKFEAIRASLGKDKLQLFALGQGLGQFPQPQAANTARLIIGGQAGAINRTALPQNLFIPTASEVWGNVQTGSLSGSTADDRTQYSLGDIHFCEMSPSTVWLLPLCQTRVSLNFCLDGLLAILNNTWESFLASYLENKEEGATLAWENSFASIGPSVAAHTKDMLERSREVEGSLIRQLETEVRNITMYSLALHSLSQGEAGWKEKGRAEYQSIIANPNIVSLDFDGDRVQFVTNHLHMLHPATEKYHNLGVLTVSFNPVRGSRSLSVFNRTPIGDLAHPHIYQGESGCQGTLSARLATLFGQGDYAEAVDLLIFFFTTVNYDDPYGARIDRFDLSEGTFGEVTYRRGEIIA